MNLLGMTISTKSQKIFINTAAVLHAVLIFFVAVSIPIIYAVFNLTISLSALGIISYCLMNTIRCFVTFQISMACFAVQKRFKVFNDKFYITFLHGSTENGSKKQFFAVFHNLCNCIATINQTIAPQLILFLPHILVSSLLESFSCLFKLIACSIKASLHLMAS